MIAEVSIDLNNVNDNSPEFSYPDSVTVPENSKTGILVTTLVVSTLQYLKGNLHICSNNSYIRSGTHFSFDEGLKFYTKDRNISLDSIVAYL